MNQTNQILAAIADAIKRKNSFLIVGHGNPDGDSLGSMCALGIGLAQIGKQITMLSTDGVPDQYAFLPGAEQIVRSLPEGASCDVAITVDCDGLERVGDAIDAVRSCGLLIDIDHHTGVERATELALVDPNWASTGEGVVSVLHAIGVCITTDIAACLLTAIITDTGSFRFSNVRPSTLRIAADLMEAGASPNRIAQQVYETKSFASVKLLGLALSTLHTSADGRIAYAFVTQEALSASGASDSDTEGMPNTVRSIQGVDVGILFREAPDGTTRVSLRSHEGYDVSRVAKLFGGGGHALASGCSLDRPLDDARDLVIDAVKTCMGF